MEFHSALAGSADLDEAVEAVCSDLHRRLGDAPFDLCVVFASATYGDAIDRLPVLLHERLSPGVLVGCTGQAQLTEATHNQDRPALSVLAGRMPGVRLAASTLTDADLPHADAPPADWRRLLPDVGGDARALLVLGEPFQCDVKALLAGLDFVLPNAPKVGGIASGSQHPGGNALFCGRQCLREGAVLMAIAGDVTVAPVVSQGCRPIGRPGRITKARHNRLGAIDGRTPREFIEEQVQRLDADDIELADGNPLFLGIASDPFAVGHPNAGDFLVRNVLGMDDGGELVVADELHVGRSVQLHVRDGSSSLDDFERQLERADADEAQAALMFRCVGRDGADHELFAAAAPDAALAGCTCNGEIGPVGETTHLHGYTASCLLLREGPGT